MTRGGAILAKGGSILSEEVEAQKIFGTRGQTIPPIAKSISVIGNDDIITIQL